MKKIVILVGVFSITSLLVFKGKSKLNPALNYTGQNSNQKVAAGEAESKEEESDHPEEFGLFQRALRTKDGDTEPAYKPGYRLAELSKAQAARIAKENSARTQSDNGVLEWKERGPANVPGRTRAVINLPGDASNLTWLAGAATGGIWKTTNGGTSWTEKSKNFTILPISSLAMSEETNTKTVYAGTGELVSTATAALGDGIFKSNDLGETWTQLTSTAANKNFQIVTRIIVDPANSDIVLASCVAEPFSTTDKKSSIQRSIDGGLTWTKVHGSRSAIEQLIATPNNFNTLYATENNIGVLKSTNGGLTWTATNGGISTTGRIELAVSPVKTSRLFASCEGGLTGTGSDLYVSDDAGAKWSLVDVTLSDKAVDFLGGQGHYDNTIACDPYNQDIVYFGGVNYFRLTLGTSSTSTVSYSLDESQTSSYITLINSGASNAGGKLTVTNNPTFSVELRFGPGKKQKAHRFLVPVNSTSGVTTANYSYQDYVDVDFEAWDVTNNKQLMVSFRDQGRDGKFDLIETNTSSSVAIEQSREYIWVNNIAYDAVTPSSIVAVSGGHQTLAVYNIWPVLAARASWPTPLNVALAINATAVPKLSSTTITVADAYSNWGGKNKANQTDFTQGVHPDHHTTVVIPLDRTAKTFKFLLGTDGGVFFSNSSSTPGIADGDLKFAGYGFNTSQFYSADKSPKADRYLGGLQDNGTRISPSSSSASAATNYDYALSGDGFEVLWNSLDEKKMLGTIYYGDIYRSTNGGVSWASAKTGLTNAGTNGSFPFFTKLSNSKKFPDRVFTIGASGVFVSNDFGSNWTLTPITSNLSGASFFADVEVSQSNASVVWAGSGMSSTRNLFVSTNGGKSFSKTTNYSGASLGGLTRLASHPTQDNTAFALFSFADSPKILRTKDLGQTWEDISGFGSGTSSTNGFPNVGVFCLYVRPDNPNIIWAGTEVGIVESLDDGKTWSILNDFPNVNVWDMKGQDDQVVIATHGRGIWTAKIGSAQLVTTPPIILSAGTSPQSKFVLQANFPIGYDSVQIVINSARVGTLKKLPANSTYLISVTGVPAGSVSSRLVGYNGTAPTQSATFNQTQLALKKPQIQYFNFFNDDNDITGFNSTSNTLSFVARTLTSPNISLQSNHNYDLSATLSAVLLQPIIVTNTNPNLSYKDVALVANDGDFVTVEGTKDGLTWKTLKAGYNSSANPNWVSAVSTNAVGTDALQVTQTAPITPTFAANDTILVRFRLSSNATGTAWGWSIDDLYIQQTPTGLEDLLPSTKNLNFSVFPNPTNASARMAYSLAEAGQVLVIISDFTGKVMGSFDLGIKSQGDHEEPIPTELPKGIYFVRIKVKGGQAVQKLMVTD